MNKSDFINAIASESGVQKKDVDAVLKAYSKVVIETVSSGDDVSLVGFGTFTSVKRAAREGRNPATNEKIKIPASVSPKFRPGKSFKEAVNSKTSKRK